MTELFLDVLNASYAASFVVLAVILARLLLKKAPRWMVCALWALVAVRLLVPGIFETSFSLVPSREIIPPQSLYDAAPQIQSGFDSIDSVVNPVYTESLRPAPGASVNPLQVWLAVGANVWFLGLLCMGLWALVSCIRVRRRLRERVRAEGNIFLCDGIDSPFIFGLFRPMICLPSTLGEEARQHVIAHENAHLRRRDHWWKPLGFALLTINWFNPLMWVAYVLLCRDIEMACDEKVVRDLGGEEKKAYSAALLSCSINPRQITACPLAFGEVGVKQRVRSVLNYKKPAFWVILVTAAVAIALAVGLLTDPAEEISELTWYGKLYRLTDTIGSYLPASDPLGTLGSIDSDDQTSVKFQGYNLSDDLLGCPIYPDGANLYLQRADGSALCFEPVPSETESFTFGNVNIHVSIPEGWETEPFGGSNYMGFRFREPGMDWASVTYWPDKVTMYKYTGTIEERSFPGGLVGEIYCLPDSGPNEWHFVYFYGAFSSMIVERPDGCNWDAQTYKDILDIIGTLSITQDGEALFTTPPYSEGEENPLGLTGRLENVTPSGATLIVEQDGTLWDRIITGSMWMLEKQVDGEWVSVMPESTVWTTIAYLMEPGTSSSFHLNWSQIVGELDPGQYRVGKHFTGERNPMFTLGLESEEVEQTCYAEFTIEAPEAVLPAPAGFSVELQKALQEAFEAYLAMTQEQQISSSTMPGFCMRDFDDWNSVEQFVGFPIPNPLEKLEGLEHGCWAGTPVGYNGASRFHITWYGNVEGHVHWLTVDSGYRRDGMRICVSASVYADPPENISYDKGWSIEHERLRYLQSCPNGETLIVAEPGEEYEARTGYLARGPILYSIRVIGGHGNGDAAQALLEELLPHFEEITTR